MAVEERVRLDGVVIGRLIGLGTDGSPEVTYAGAPAMLPARATVTLGPGDVGAEVALVFEGGDPLRPLVIGRLLRPEASGRDDRRLSLAAEQEIVLRCGEASITLTRAGKVLIRGTYVASRSSGANRIRGASVELN